MTVTATLSFLEAVVQEHLERLPDTALKILPCVHDGIETKEDAELVGAAVRRAGGVYVRCGPEVRDLSFPEPLNEPLARHLTEQCALYGIKIEFSTSEGQVHVRVDGSEHPTASSATLAQVLGLLCSSLVKKEFVVYSYATEGLDRARAQVLWSAAAAVPNFPPPGLQTLVAVAAGWVDVGLHCNSAEGAARLVVRGSDVIRRAPRRTPDSRIAGLVTSVDDPVVLFLGAGASASARIPQGDALRDAAIGYVTANSEGSDNVVATFRQYLEDRPHRFMTGERELTLPQFAQTLTLERVLREEFHKSSGRPRSETETVRDIARYCEQARDRIPPGRSAVWRLAELMPRLAIATINFDELIEDGMTAEHLVVASEADFSEARGVIENRMVGKADSVPILKVHGSIAEPDTMIADIETTRRGLAVPIEQALDALFSGATPVTWLWVGCSMRDVDLRHWLQRYEADKIREYWVDPLPPSSVAEYVATVRAREWAMIGHKLPDRQITESSDVFLPALVRHVESLRLTS